MSTSKTTLAEFLAWENEQTERHEFYRGEIFGMAGDTARHNRVVLNLSHRISDHLDGTGCQVFAESVKVQLPTEGILYPDLMVMCGKADAGDEQVVADPKLIIEVLSPSITGLNKRNKFILYRTLASMREYVLIDPVKRQVEVFTLKEASAWLLTDQTGARELSMASIDCKLSMEFVFKGAVGGSG